MPTLDVPFLGHVVLALLLVSSVSTFVLALAAERGRPHALVAARYGTYTTCALTGLAVALLGYSFLTHDFRITYVARYSDRAMSWYYLVTALWGGQDGSILWWTFLLAGYTAIATATLRDRLLPLQPIFLATLMVLFTFFAVLMLYPADPFATQAGSTPADGEGLNPLLQNYWMTIHPPSLYLGFVGWSIPFAFVFSALVTGKLDDDWLKAARPWAMVAWTFLSLGLLLGCLWSYEELGWGGYWAWDPVENASFMPWLVGTAYLHSAVVQERRGILRTWTAFLLCLTFFMTIFGTFLTRSGLIASVHSFAKSDIGTYFGVFLVILLVAITTALSVRAKSLATEQRFEGLLSREFAFLFNNWILLSMMAFVLGVTTYPLLNEAFTGEEATLGPPFYNMYMPFLGLLLLLLTGLGPLLAWRRTSAAKLRTALAFPGGLALLVTALHVAFGARFGYPAYVVRPPIADNPVGRAVATMNSALPAISTGLVAFVLATVVQEFVRGTRARMKVRGESVDVAFLTLVSRARRTYGGYVVHAGIALLFFGFTGAAYDYEQEATLRPGGTMRIGAYRLEYREPAMRMDPEKRIVETRMALRRGETSLGGAAPAKFIYRARPDMPTTEPSITRALREDLYVTMSAVDPQTRRATFKAQVRPWVDWIWVGGALGLLGSLLAMLPDPRDALKAKRAAPTGARTTRAARVRGLAMAALALGFVLVPTLALGQDSSSAHAGHVHLDNADERTLFPRLLCQCGSCPRLPLDSCVCDWAEQKRQELRVRLEAGETIAQVQRAYAATYGQRAISVPEDRGAGRALWLAPLTVSLAAAAGLFVYGRRHRVASASAGSAATTSAGATEAPLAPELDARLDAELERYEEEGE